MLGLVGTESEQDSSNIATDDLYVACATRGRGHFDSASSPAILTTFDTRLTKVEKSILPLYNSTQVLNRRGNSESRRLGSRWIQQMLRQTLRRRCSRSTKLRAIRKVSLLKRLLYCAGRWIPASLCILTVRMRLQSTARPAEHLQRCSRTAQRQHRLPILPTRLARHGGLLKSFYICQYTDFHPAFRPDCSRRAPKS